MELTNCDFKQVIAEDKLYILHQGEREHVMFAKFLREFVLVLGKKKKNAGLLFNISIRKLKLFVPQIRQESHAGMSPLKLPQMKSHDPALPSSVPGGNGQTWLGVILDQRNGTGKSP